MNVAATNAVTTLPLSTAPGSAPPHAGWPAGSPITDGEVTWTCAPGDVVLRSALREGLGFPYECNVGSCGNCKFELIEGEVEMAWPEAPGWSDKDRQRRRYLGCQARPLTACKVKLRRSERYVPVRQPGRARATLASRTVVTHDIHELVFMLDAPLAFEPGQYALLELPGVAGPRAYSMSNAPTEATTRWEFQVRRLPNGIGTRALFELEPGATIGLDGPYGMAYLRRDAKRDILCLAGGSGLAPMISIARAAMTDAGMADVQLQFVYGGRTPEDLCGETMLRELPGYGTRLQYTGVVSTPETEGSGTGPVWGGLTGFVHEHAFALFGERLAEMEIYFAGPPAMASAVQRTLVDAKVPMDHVHFDQFY